MWQWFKDQARRIFSWIDGSVGKTVASLVALVITVYICVVVGGILAQACIITLCVYVGTLITLNRMRRPPPKDASKFWKSVTAPIRSFANFFFTHSLITTLALGFIASSMVGLTTVTGIAVAALCAFAGDIIVIGFVSAVDLLREIKSNDGEEVRDVKVKEVAPQAA